MKKRFCYLLLTFLILITACNNFGKDLFAKKSAREVYVETLKKKNPLLLTSWESAGKFAMDNPFQLSDSYAEHGTTNSGVADANAYLINLKPGQQVIASYSTDSLRMPAFLEIWERKEDGRNLLASADSLTKTANYFSVAGGDYLIKFQPKIESKTNFKLNIQLAAGLDFPLELKAKSNIGSLWGDPRDGGTRKHEGIDIFAARGSDILAEADGTIGYLDDTEIGGKVVSLRPKGQNFSIYHAHLDEQLVQTGQQVTKGQIIGKVGNTGNAKTTVPHLHLGIYTNAGAVDPLYFVKKTSLLSTINPRKLNEKLKFSSSAILYPGPFPKNAYSNKGGFIAVTEGFTNGFYRVRLEDGSKGFVQVSELKKAK